MQIVSIKIKCDVKDHYNPFLECWLVPLPSVDWCPSSRSYRRRRFDPIYDMNHVRFGRDVERAAQQDATASADADATA